MKHFVGIDIANASHYVSIVDGSGKLVKHFKITNDYNGFENLRECFSKYSDVSIALENSHGHLVDYLRKLKFNIYAINPLKIKRFKESYLVSGDKNDYIDSVAIAQYLRVNNSQCKPIFFNSKEIETLRLLGITHEKLTGDHTRYTNRLLFLFKQYFPLYDGLFTDKTCKNLLKMVIKYPKWSILKMESREVLVDFFKQNRYCNKRYIERTLEKIKNYNHCISKEVEIAMSIEAVSISRLLLSLKDSIQEVENNMHEILKNNYLGKIMNSLPGAGVVLASKILGFMGDNKDRFTHYGHPQALFGTAPINYQSGSYHRVSARRACNKIARSVFYKFSFCSLNFCPWAREYYDKQRKKGKTHSVSIRALSNKWVKIIFSMWKHETQYSSDFLKRSLVA